MPLWCSQTATRVHTTLYMIWGTLFLQFYVFLRDIKPAQQLHDSCRVTILRIEHMLALAQARCHTVACSGV